MGFIIGHGPAQSRGHPDAGPKLAALTGNRLLYRDGIPIADLAGGETRFDETLDPAAEWQARKALLRGTVPLARNDLSVA